MKSSSDMNRPSGQRSNLCAQSNAAPSCPFVFVLVMSPIPAGNNHGYPSAKILFVVNSFIGSSSTLGNIKGLTWCPFVVIASSSFCLILILSVFLFVDNVGVIPKISIGLDMSSHVCSDDTVTESAVSFLSISFSTF